MARQCARLRERHIAALAPEGPHVDVPLIVNYQARALLECALARLAVSILKGALEDSLELGAVMPEALDVAINLDAHFLVGCCRKDFEAGVCLLSCVLRGLRGNLSILSLGSL